ncbi:RNA polymerase Rpb3/Rpb11 dimerization domain [Fragilaria crotonensis]|nr:RNA polymerase Rpb3/Rpb11 dimerization domain [Fragilaria crotonensis]
MSVNEVRNPVAKFQLEVRGEGGASTFCIGDEDHTLANALRHILMNDASNVEFAGYSVPHPSEPVVQIRVQTIPKPQGRKLAVRSLQEACNTLSEQCQYVIDQLEAILPETKEDRLRNEERLLEEARRDEEEDASDDGKE